MSGSMSLCSTGGGAVESSSPMIEEHPQPPASHSEGQPSQEHESDPLPPAYQAVVAEDPRNERMEEEEEEGRGVEDSWTARDDMLLMQQQQEEEEEDEEEEEEKEAYQPEQTGPDNQVLTATDTALAKVLPDTFQRAQSYPKELMPSSPMTSPSSSSSSSQNRYIHTQNSSPQLYSTASAHPNQPPPPSYHISAGAISGAALASGIPQHPTPYVPAPTPTWGGAGYYGPPPPPQNVPVSYYGYQAPPPPHTLLPPGPVAGVFHSSPGSTPPPSAYVAPQSSPSSTTLPRDSPVGGGGGTPKVDRSSKPTTMALTSLG